MTKAGRVKSRSQAAARYGKLIDQPREKLCNMGRIQVKGAPAGLLKNKA